MEAVHQPACTPCGHVYCWKCIMTWASNSSNGAGAGTGTRAGNRDDDQVRPVKSPSQISQSNIQQPSQISLSNLSVEVARFRVDGQILLYYYY